MRKLQINYDEINLIQELCKYPNYQSFKTVYFEKHGLRTELERIQYIREDFHPNATIEKIILFYEYQRSKIHTFIYLTGEAPEFKIRIPTNDNKTHYIEQIEIAPGEVLFYHSNIPIEIEY